MVLLTKDPQKSFTIFINYHRNGPGMAGVQDSQFAEKGWCFDAKNKSSVHFQVIIPSGSTALLKSTEPLASTPTSPRSALWQIQFTSYLYI